MFALEIISVITWNDSYRKAWMNPECFACFGFQFCTTTLTTNAPLSSLVRPAIEKACGTLERPL